MAFGRLLIVLSLAASGCADLKFGSSDVHALGDPGGQVGPGATTPTISAASTYVTSASPITFRTAPNSTATVRATGAARNYEVLFGPYEPNASDEGVGTLDEADSAESTRQGAGPFWITLDGWAWLIGWYPIVHGDVIIAGSDGTSMVMIVQPGNTGFDRAILFEGGPVHVWRKTDLPKAHVVLLNPGEYIQVDHSFNGNLDQSMVHPIPWPLDAGEIAPAGEGAFEQEFRAFVEGLFDEAASHHLAVPADPTP